MLFNKLKLMWQGFVEKFHYRLDNFFTKGAVAQGTLLFLLTAAIVLTGSCAALFGLFSTENSEIGGIGRKIDNGLIDALWWAAMHIFDPAYISQNYGATWPVVLFSLFVSLMGLIIFGALTGFMSSLFEGKIAQLASGSSPVREEGHILILGWNDKIYSILDLFEDYHRRLVVVVLSNHSIADMNDMMRTERSTVRRIKPILRKGSPTSLVELERMAFRKAYSIIVLSDQSELSRPEEHPDIRTIKTLMLLAGNLPQTPPRPKMVAEILWKDNMEVARIAAKNSISLVCSSEVLSRMIVQSSRQPGLSYVYNELFGFAGSEIYVAPFPKAANRRFGDLITDFPNAIPIGISGMEMRAGKPFFKQRINPGQDYLVGESEWLIMIAPDNRIEHVPNLEYKCDALFKDSSTRIFAREKILVLGWNKNLLCILTEYDGFLAPGSEIVVVALLPKEEAESIFAEKLEGSLKSATLRYVQADYVDKKKLQAILDEGFETAIVLADESSQQVDTDSKVIVTVLLLQDYQERNPHRRLRQMVSEVASTANSELLNMNSKTDIIVSPRLTSMLIAQISQQLMLERVYNDLMDAHVNEIYLKPAQNYVARGCAFRDIQLAAGQFGEIAIGVKLVADKANHERSFGVQINPPKDRSYSFVEGDEVVVISRS